MIRFEVWTVAGSQPDIFEIESPEKELTLPDWLIFHCVDDRTRPVQPQAHHQALYLCPKRKSNYLKFLLAKSKKKVNSLQNAKGYENLRAPVNSEGG